MSSICGSSLSLTCCGTSTPTPSPWSQGGPLISPSEATCVPRARLLTQDQRPTLRPRSPPAGRSRLASTTSPAWPRPPAHPPHLPMALEHHRHLAHHPRPRPCHPARPRGHSVRAAAATAQSTCWRLRLEPRKSPRRPRWAELALWRTSTPFTSCHVYYPRVPCTSQQAENT